jgi:tetratricopeptide (TPR) repeat protein
MFIKEFLSSKNVLYSIIFLAFLSHISYIPNDFTWLDHGDIEAGRSIVPITNLPTVFFNNFGNTRFYRPIVTLLNSIDFAIYSLNPYGFHLTNVFLHMGIVFALYFFIQAYFNLGKRTSLLATFTFAIHPISWLPVGAISYRQELLVSLFSLCAIYSHIKVRMGVKKLSVLLYISLLLAFFSKETAVFWLPSLIYLWEAKNQKNILIKLKRIHFIEIGALFFYLILRFLAIPEFWKSHTLNLPIITAIGTRLLVLSKQFIIMLSPLKPPLSDATMVTPLFALIPIISLLFLSAIFLLIVKLKFFNTYSQVIIFILITIIPVLNIIPLPRFNSPHYAYFSLVGFSTLVSMIYFKYKGKFIIIISILLAIWIVIATYSTFFAGFHFKDDLSLFIPETRADNNFREGHFYMADYYLKNSEFKKAEEHYELAMKKNNQVISYVDEYSTVLNLAGAKLGLKKYDEAEKLLVEAINSKYNTKDQKLIYNLALVYWYKKDYLSVVNTLSQYGEEWDSPEPLLLGARAYVNLDEKEKAVNLFKKALKFLDVEERQQLELLIENDM